MILIPAWNSHLFSKIRVLNPNSQLLIPGMTGQLVLPSLVSFSLKSSQIPIPNSQFLIRNYSSHSPLRGPPSPAFQPSVFFAHGNDCPGRLRRHFFQSSTSLCPATGCLANFFLSTLEASDDRSKHKSLLSESQNHEKKTIGGNHGNISR